MIWTFSEIWNKSVEQREVREIKPREKIWASELGKSDLDIYLKMIGEAPSNDFDDRSIRKFEAGNLFEWIIKIILTRCGIYQESQKWVGYKKDDQSVEVSGKIDHLAGGKINFEKAKQELEVLQLPDFFTKATENILAYFQNKYPEGLPQQGIEVKSTSSFGIEKVYYTGKALAGHDLQAFHYAYNTKIPFIILYICRDDLRMADIPIMPDNEELLNRYHSKIASVSNYFLAKQEPPKEPEIFFDENEGKFTKNFNIEYSGFLTRNYGYKEPMDYSDKWSGIVESWNRVLGRIKQGKEMTKNNLEKFEEMKAMGFDVDFIKSKIIKL